MSSRPGARHPLPNPTRGSGSRLAIPETPVESVEEVRVRLVSTALAALAVLGLPVLVLAFIRGVKIGIHWAAYVYLGLYVVVLVGAVGRWRLPHRVKVGLLLGAWFGLGVASLLAFGLTGAAALHFVTASVAAALFAGARVAAIGLLGSLLFTAIVGAATILGWITFRVDVAELASLPVAWGLRLAVMAFLGSVLIVCIDRLHRAFAQDIGRRKQAEKERERLAIAVEHAAEAIILTDTDGTIQYVNPAFERITGFGRDVAIGENPRILKSGRHGPEFYELLWSTITSGDTWTGRFKNRRKDGTIYDEAATISPIREDDGSIVGYVAVKRDVTEESRLNQQLRQAQKMQAIGTLAGGIAHDFNNILMAVLGFAELALAGAEASPDTQRDIGEVLKAAQRARDLVAQILAFSRQKEEERRPIQLQLVAKETLRLLRASLPATIEIQTHIDPKCSPILADPTRVHQVVMNLCTNAYHAMREGGGTLHVTVEQVDIDAEQAAAHLELREGTYGRLTVSDTGVGMDATTLERIFEPYFTTRAAGEGTGLGMAVVHSIVKAHDGVITIDSELGVGTTVEVYFPVAARTDDVIVAATDLPPLPEGSERVLLVDDEHAITAVGERFLSRLGYSVTTCASAVDALTVFNARPDDFDVVVTDLTMPRMTGVELAPKLSEIRPDIPIILCTGYGETIDSDAVACSGVRETITKPLVMRDLATVVRRVLDTPKA